MLSARAVAAHTSAANTQAHMMSCTTRAQEVALRHTANRYPEILVAATIPGAFLRQNGETRRALRLEGRIAGRDECRNSFVPLVNAREKLSLRYLLQPMSYVNQRIGSSRCFTPDVGLVLTLFAPVNPSQSCWSLRARKMRLFYQYVPTCVQSTFQHYVLRCEVAIWPPSTFCPRKGKTLP